MFAEFENGLGAIFKLMFFEIIFVAALLNVPLHDIVTVSPFEVLLPQLFVTLHV